MNERTYRAESHHAETESAEVLARLHAWGTDRDPGSDTEHITCEAAVDPALVDDDLEALVLSAWLTVLRRFSGAETITVATRTSLRAAGELSAAIGPLSAWLEVRHVFEPGQSTGELIARVVDVRSQQRESAHRLTKSSAARIPLGFLFVAANGGARVAESIKASGLPAQLCLVAYRNGERLSISLSGAAVHDLGSQLRKQMLEALEVLLSHVPNGEDAAKPLDRAILGTPAAPQFGTVNATSAAWSGNTLADLLEMSAARRRDATAVIHGSRRVTYAELWEQGATVSDYLRSLDVGVEDIVAVNIADPVDRLIAQLGVIQVGAAYLIAGHGQQQERVSRLLATAAPKAVITDVNVPHGHRRDPVAAHQLIPENLVYLIQTSGSTGEPKLVGVTHANIVNYLGTMVDAGLISELTALPATSAPIFDASVKQVWGPLVVGGTVLFPLDDSAPAGVIAAAIASKNATTVNSVPQVWAEALAILRRELPGGALPNRAVTVMLGGDRLPGSLVELTRRILPAARIWNMYGPSETTANASFGPVSEQGRPTLGKPVSGSSLHLLDEGLAPVPPGVVGEIHVGGACVSRGYVGAPAATADRFIPDPFSTVPGARLYRTGDLGRWTQDGQLMFWRRNDLQVKVNGLRVELGEVETVIARHPLVGAAVAILQEDRLAAWVVPVGQDLPAAEDIREHCESLLPVSMIPAVVSHTTTLPLTPGGKIDRSALSHMPVSPLPLRSASVSPQTDMEATVHAVWQSVLDVQSVGVHDNFFAVGGDSIRVLRITTLIRERTGIDVTMVQLLSAPTIAAQAAMLVSIASSACL